MIVPEGVAGGTDYSYLMRLVAQHDTLTDTRFHRQYSTFLFAALKRKRTEKGSTQKGNDTLLHHLNLDLSSTLSFARSLLSHNIPQWRTQLHYNSLASRRTTNRAEEKKNRGKGKSSDENQHDSEWLV